MMHGPKYRFKMNSYFLPGLFEPIKEVFGKIRQNSVCNFMVLLYKLFEIGFFDG
jgi:hypothetical protein